MNVYKSNNDFRYSVFIILLLLLIPSSIKGQNDDSTSVARISVVGDLMCHSVQFKYSEVGKDSFDFNPVYRMVKPYLSLSDFTFGNLETVTAGSDKVYSGYPRFNSPDEYITALKEAGFDLLSTANNHALDRKDSGLLRTIKVLKQNNLYYNGTFTSESDRDSIRIFNINGIRIAFLAYTYGTNGNPVPKEKPYLINLINYHRMNQDIKLAREEGSEVVLVHLHYGTEYLREPDNYEKSVVDSLINYGADIIIGGHPHVIQPLRFFHTKDNLMDSGFVAYSLGNFFSNQRWRYSDAGVILTFSIKKNFTSGKIKISNIDLIPTWVYKGPSEKGNEFVIIPSQYFYTDEVFKYFDKVDYQEMFRAFSDTREILLKYFPGHKLNLNN